MPTDMPLARATRRRTGDSGRDNNARAKRLGSRRGDGRAFRRNGGGRPRTVGEVRRAACRRDAGAHVRAHGRGGAQRDACCTRRRPALWVPRSGRLVDKCGNPSPVGTRCGGCRTSRCGPSNASRTSRGRRGGQPGHARRLAGRYRIVGRNAVGRRRGIGDRGRRGRRSGRRLIWRRGKHRCGRVRRRRSRTSRQEADWIDVPLVVGRDPDAEVDVRRGHLGVGTRPDRPHRVALSHGRPFREQQRAQMRERDGVAVRREDRDAPPGSGNSAGERHLPRRRRDHRRAGVARDVDAAMLPRGVGMCGIERVGLDDGAVRRPAPGCGGRGEEQRGQNGQRDEASHSHLPRSLLSTRQTCRQR